MSQLKNGNVLILEGRYQVYQFQERDRTGQTLLLQLIPELLVLFKAQLVLFGSCCSSGFKSKRQLRKVPEMLQRCLA